MTTTRGASTQRECDSKSGGAAKRPRSFLYKKSSARGGAGVPRGEARDVQGLDPQLFGRGPVATRGGAFLGGHRIGIPRPIVRHASMM